MPALILNRLKDKISSKDLFQTFNYVYNKNYDLSHPEIINNFKNFKENLKNSKEFSANYDKLEISNKANKFLSKEDSFLSDTSIDWRGDKCISPVPKEPFTEWGTSLNVAAVSAAEFAICKRLNNYSIQLSTQQSLDCFEMPWFSSIFYPLYKPGLYYLYDYPNVGKKSNCRALNAQTFKVSKWENAYTYFYEDKMTRDQDSISKALKKGPVIAGFNFFIGEQDYKGGIYTPTQREDGARCGYYFHALVVGYGVENGVNYWILRMYFGQNWGENGYMRLKRDDSRMNWGIDCEWYRPSY